MADAADPIRFRRVASALLAIASLATAGCKEKATTVTPGADAGTHATSASLTPEQAARVLARVGDRTITLGDFVATLEHMDQFDRLRYQSPERRKELLEEMIRIELLAGEAVAKGYDQDPVAQQEQRAILRDALLAEARKGAPMPNEIPEGEVRAHYDAHRDAFRDPERRRTSLIVLRDEATARAVLATVKPSTATEWGDRVRTKSIDPQAKANVPVDLAGDFGMVSPPGDPRGANERIPEEVRAALFEIPEIGGVLDRPVAAGGKFYLVRLTQKADAHERSFGEAERAIRIQLAQDKARAKEDELLASLRKDFPVTIDDAALAQVKVRAADGGAPAPSPAGP